MFRSALTAVCAASLLAVAAPAADAGEPILPLALVHPGLTCQATSVVQGIEPVPFDAQVISVEGGPNPADAVIVMRFSGAAVDGTGIGEGFSGSPVRCLDGAGVWRVIGAIALGIGQYDNTVAGVRPIEAMLGTPTWGIAPKTVTLGRAASAAQLALRGTAASTEALTKPKSKSKSKSKSKTKSKSKQRSKTTTAGSRSTSGKRKKAKQVTPATPQDAWQRGLPLLTLRGPQGPLATAISSAAEQAGIPLITAPAATRLQVPGTMPLKPGDAVTASIVTGDVALGATGTVTYVDGERVWAFGHAFSGIGPSRLLMQRAAISTIIGSPSIGEQVTYKLGAPFANSGTVGFDGSAAIGGVIGATPQMIPVRATIRDPKGTPLAASASNIVDERSVRGSNLSAYLGLLSGTSAATALQHLSTQSALGGSVRACVRITLKDEKDRLSTCLDSIVVSPTSAGGVETEALYAISEAVAPVVSAERFANLVQAVDIDMEYRNEADSATIVEIRRPNRVRAGSTITIHAVVVQGSSGERREVPLKVRIPRFARGVRTAIVVLGSQVGGGAGAGMGGAGDLVEVLLGDDSPAPKNLEELKSLYGTTDGVSGLRVAVVPGIGAGTAMSLLSDSGDGGDLSEEEFAALLSQVRLKKELPTVALDGDAAVTVHPR